MRQTRPISSTEPRISNLDRQRSMSSKSRTPFNNLNINQELRNSSKRINSLLRPLKLHNEYITARQVDPQFSQDYGGVGFSTFTQPKKRNFKGAIELSYKNQWMRLSRGLQNIVVTENIMVTKKYPKDLLFANKRQSHQISGVLQSQQAMQPQIQQKIQNQTIWKQGGDPNRRQVTLDGQTLKTIKTQDQEEQNPVQPEPFENLLERLEEMTTKIIKQTKSPREDMDLTKDERLYEHIKKKRKVRKQQTFMSTEIHYQDDNPAQTSATLQSQQNQDPTKDIINIHIESSVINPTITSQKQLQIYQSKEQLKIEDYQNVPHVIQVQNPKQLRLKSAQHKISAPRTKSNSKANMSTHFQSNSAYDVQSFVKVATNLHSNHYRFMNSQNKAASQHHIQNGRRLFSAVGNRGKDQEMDGNLGNNRPKFVRHRRLNNSCYNVKDQVFNQSKRESLPQDSSNYGSAARVFVVEDPKYKPYQDFQRLDNSITFTHETNTLRQSSNRYHVEQPENNNQHNLSIFDKKNNISNTNSKSNISLDSSNKNNLQVRPPSAKFLTQKEVDYYRKKSSQKTTPQILSRDQSIEIDKQTISTQQNKLIEDNQIEKVKQLREKILDSPEYKGQMADVEILSKIKKDLESEEVKNFKDVNELSAWEYVIGLRLKACDLVSN